jgi:hypothetical protein
MSERVMLRKDTFSLLFLKILTLFTKNQFLQHHTHSNKMVLPLLPKILFQLLSMYHIIPSQGHACQSMTTGKHSFQSASASSFSSLSAPISFDPSSQKLRLAL